MADNITLNTGSGGATIAADDVSSVWYQRVKLTDGTADSTTPINAGNGTAANAIRVTVASDSTGVIGVTDNSGSLTVDNNGTFAVQATVAAGATNIAKAEDVASADADVGVPAMAVRKATPANTSGTDGDYEMLQMYAGRLWVDASGKTLTVDGSGATQPVSYATTGSGNATGALRVELANNGIGQISTVSTVTSVTAIGASVTTGTSAAHVGKAEDAAASSGDTGVFVLGVRNDTLATATTSTDADYSQLSVDSLGRLITTHAPHGIMVHGNASATGTSDTSLVAAGGASIKNYITDILAANTGASTTLLTIKDGSGGSTLLTTIVPAGGGSNIQLKTPIVGSANTAIYFACGAASTTVYVSAHGYKAL